MLQRRTEGLAMREMSAREANQNFSKVISAAEKGETIDGMFKSSHCCPSE
jgi:hypothetical protein